MKNNKIQENINYFLSQVDIKLCNPLRNKKQRFPSSDKLLGKFRDQEKGWKVKGITLVNDIVAMTNELCLANLILDNAACEKLDYEPTPNSNNSQKTIDFCISMNNGNIVYCDVKTIQPIRQDDWDKFNKIKEYFPKNVYMILSKNDGGGEILHDSYNSRSTMLCYTLELEKKIMNYRKNHKTSFIMIFCGDGYDWKEDELEDFADFYRTGKHNPDDAFLLMENKYIENKGIEFLRNIDGFAYLERPKTSIKETKFMCPVCGPWIENRWVSSTHTTC